MADPALIALQVNDAVLAGRETKNQEADFRRNIGSKHYKPLKTPADIELAKKHGKAKRVYVGKQHDHDEEEVEERKEVCICCGLPLEGEPIALCDELDKLYHLGSGFALYFRFIKYTMSLLVLIMIISGIYNLITNSTNQGCADDTLAPVVLDAAYCVQGYVLSYAIPNKREESDLLMVQAALNLGVVVAIMFFFHYIRYRFRRTEIEADDKTITPSDYTIAIEGLPPQTKNSEIVAWIKTLQTEDMPLIVERIIRPYDINEYLNLTNSYNKLCKHEMSHNNPKGGHEMSESEKKEHEQEMKQIDQRLNELKQEGAIKNCPVAYVTFRTAAQASFVSSKFKKTLFRDMFGCLMAKVKKTDDQINGVRVEVERAPEPTDIQWLNLRFTDNQRAVKRYFTNTTTFVLIALSFGLIILVNWGQNQAIKKYGKGSGVVQGLSIVASVVIAVTNTALTLLIDYLTRYEKHLTNTKFLKGVAQKLAIAQFFNTALTSFFAEMILAEETDDHDNRLEAMNFYGKGGLLEGIFWVFVTNAITGPALTIFDSAYFMKLFQQNRVSKQGDKNTLIQKDAQALFEGPTLNMPAKYAAMIKSILLTTFYAPALPIAMVFTIVGLFLSYWADKYVLLKRNALPLSLDDDLADAMIEIIEWSAFTWAAGNLIYIYSLHAADDHHAFPDTARILGWIGLGLSAFHIFFPMEALNEKLFPIKDEVTESETYDHVRLEFNTDYDLEDPNLKRKALNKFVKRINNVKKVAKNMSPASGGSKLFDVVNKASGSPNAKGASDSPREKRPPGPNDQPVIKEPKLDFRSLDQFANVLKEEEPHPHRSSPAKSARELAKSSPRLEEVPEVKENEAQPRQENPEEVHQETETPFKQLEQVEAHDMKSEEQRFIQPQEVQYQPEVHSNQEEQNHVELAVHQETPVQNQSVHYEEKKTPSVHMEPLHMEEQQNVLGDDSYNVKSDECLETPDASRRVFYVNRSLFSKE